MGDILIVSLIIVAVLLIVSILLQHQGAGIGGAFGGGEGNFYRSRRGVEKALFNFTIILAVLFAVISLVKIVVK